MPTPGLHGKKDMPCVDPRAHEICAKARSIVRPKPSQILDPAVITVAVPPGPSSTCSPSQHDKRCMQYMLCDDMGNGKTFTSLVSSYHVLGQDLLFVVISPVNVLSNWVRELWNSYPDPVKRQHQVIVRYPQDQLELQADDCWQILAVVLSEQQLCKAACQNDLECLISRTSRTAVLIVDEAHRFSNEQADSTQALFSIRRHVDHVVLLTATPVANDINELKTLALLVGRGRIGLPSTWDKHLTLYQVQHMLQEAGLLVRRRRNEISARNPKLRQYVTSANTLAQHVASHRIYSSMRGCMNAEVPGADSDSSSVSNHMPGEATQGQTLVYHPGGRFNPLEVQAQTSKLAVAGCLHASLAPSFLVPLQASGPQSTELYSQLLSTESTHASSGSRSPGRQSTQSVLQEHTKRWRLALERERLVLAGRLACDVEQKHEDRLRGLCRSIPEASGVQDAATTYTNPVQRHSHPSATSGTSGLMGLLQERSKCVVAKETYHPPSPWALAETSWLLRYVLTVLPIHIRRREKVVLYLEPLASVFLCQVVQMYLTYVYNQERKEAGVTGSETTPRWFLPDDDPPIVCVYHGGLNHGQRSNSLSDFRGNDAAWFIVLTKAGGVGTNLDPGRVVWGYADGSFNDLYPEQALCRCDRANTQTGVAREVTLRTSSHLPLCMCIVQYNKAFLSATLLGDLGSYLTFFPVHMRRYWDPAAFTEARELARRLSSVCLRTAACARALLQPWPVLESELYAVDDWEAEAKNRDGSGGMEWALSFDASLRKAQLKRRRRLASVLKATDVVRCLLPHMHKVVVPVNLLLDLCQQPHRPAAASACTASDTSPLPSPVNTSTASGSGSNNVSACGFTGGVKTGGQTEMGNLETDHVGLFDSFGVQAGLPVMSTQELFDYFRACSNRALDGAQDSSSSLPPPVGCGYRLSMRKESVLSANEPYAYLSVSCVPHSSDVATGTGPREKVVQTTAAGGSEDPILLYVRLQWFCRSFIMRLSDMLMYLHWIGDKQPEQTKEGLRGRARDDADEPRACVPGADFTMHQFHRGPPSKLYSSLGVNIARAIAPYVRTSDADHVTGHRSNVALSSMSSTGTEKEKKRKLAMYRAVQRVIHTTASKMQKK